VLLLFCRCEKQACYRNLPFYPDGWSCTYWLNSRIFILTVQVILISFEGVIFQQEKQIQSLVYKALVFGFYILNIKLYISAFLTVRRWHST